MMDIFLSLDGYFQGAAAAGTGWPEESVTVYLMSLYDLPEPIMYALPDRKNTAGDASPPYRMDTINNVAGCFRTGRVKSRNYILFI